MPPRFAVGEAAQHPSGAHEAGPEQHEVLALPVIGPPHCAQVDMGVRGRMNRRGSEKDGGLVKRVRTANLFTTITFNGIVTYFLA